MCTKGDSTCPLDSQSILASKARSLVSCTSKVVELAVIILDMKRDLAASFKFFSVIQVL